MPTINALLDKFIIMDDVDLIPENFPHSFEILGPELRRVLPACRHDRGPGGYRATASL